MPTVVYYSAASLDGYVAEADDTIDWLTSYGGSYDGADAQPMEGSYEEFYDTVGALVMGSATYEFVLGRLERGGSWPYAGKPSWVLSSRDLPVPEGEGGDDVRVVSGSVPELYEEMAAAAGERSLWVVGGGDVASQFAGAGLLDEVRVHVVPVVLASGKRLFARRLPGGPMRLVAAVVRDNGMVELRYELRR